MLSPVCRPHGLGSRMQIVSAFKSVEVFSFLVQSKYETRVIECRVLSRHRLNPSKTSSFLHPFPHPPLCISNLFPPRYARPVSLLQFSNIIIHLHASTSLASSYPKIPSICTDPREGEGVATFVSRQQVRSSFRELLIDAKRLTGGE